MDKPALLRRLFELTCAYSGQVLSYTKMLGQLQDAGNTTTLAHYLDLLAGAGLVTGLQKHLANAASVGDCTIYYWRHRNREVDFVAKAGGRLTAIEVKSGRARGALAGMETFAREFQPQRTLLVGGDGIGLEDFLSRPVTHWLSG